jgi:hypothetical protein
MIRTYDDAIMPYRFQFLNTAVQKFGHELEQDCLPRLGKEEVEKHYKSCVRDCLRVANPAPVCPECNDTAEQWTNSGAE